MLHAGRDETGDPGGGAVRPFVMRLDSASGCERIENVVSFVGADRSGSFGIMAGHARMLTFLSFGLARFRLAGGETEYLALPGGLLYFVANELRISTQRYFRSKDSSEMENVLDRELREEEENLKATRASLRRLDEGILRRLLTLRLEE